MTVDVYCDDCKDVDDRGDEHPVAMEIFGSLFFNNENNAQSQAYKCPNCEYVVVVVIVTP